MAEVTYTTAPAKLRHLIEKIPDTGVPTRVTIKELEARGFRSSNDRSIIPVLRAINLITPDGVPTDAWQQFRNRAQSKAVMARLVRDAYRDLFDMYPDAHARSETDIRNFMVSRTRAGERAVQYMVATFKTLASLADFGSEQAPYDPPTEEPLPSSRVTVKSNRGHVDVSPQIHVNLQIQIPETANAEMIDTIFRSMATNIFGREA
jgi:hypothetical protein